MSLKEQILAALQTGPATDAELATQLNMPQASVRRSRGELTKEGTVLLDRVQGRNRYWRVQTLAEEREPAPRFVIVEPTPGKPAPTPASAYTRPRSTGPSW